MGFQRRDRVTDETITGSRARSDLRPDHQHSVLNAHNLPPLSGGLWSFIPNHTHPPARHPGPVRVHAVFLLYRLRGCSLLLSPRAARGVDRSLKTTTTHQTRLRWTASIRPNRPHIFENPILSSQLISHGADFHWVSISSESFSPLLRKIPIKQWDSQRV